MKLVVSALLVAAAVPADAVAQSASEIDTGSRIAIPRRARIDEADGLSKIDRSRRAMADFARCAVDRGRARVPGFVAIPAQEVKAKDFEPFTKDECLDSGMMRFKPILIRGALFSELYKRRSVPGNSGKAWTFAPASFDEKASFDVGDADLANQMALLSFANCVAKRNPAIAQAVVSARTVSVAQDTAFTSLMPDFRACLFADQKVTLGKSIVEGALAEVLYRSPVTQPISAETK